MQSLSGAFGAQRPVARAHSRPSRCCVVASATATGTKPISIHVGETTVTMPFSSDKAQQLDVAFQKLFQTFAEKQAATRPKRWDMLEMRFVGAPDTTDAKLIEVYCNPNAYTTAFEAKLLITLESRDGVKVTTEARLSAIKADLDSYLQDCGVKKP